MIDRYPINIIHRSSKKSIQSDNNQSHNSVGGVLLTERTHRQTNKQTTTLFHIYNKKKYIYIPQTTQFIFTDKIYIHTVQTKQKQNIEPPPVAPRRQSTYRQTIRTNTQTGVSIFHVSIFERGKLISEGGEAFDQSEGGIFLCTAIKLTLYYK